MQHRVDVMLLQDATDEFTVTDVADDQRRADDGLAEASAEIVQHDDFFARRDELQHRVTADVSCATRDQNRAVPCHVQLQTPGLDDTGCTAAPGCLRHGMCAASQPARPMTGR